MKNFPDVLGWFVERILECSFHQISDILTQSQNIANTYEKKDPFFYSEENPCLLSAISPVKSRFSRPKLLLFLPKE